jgi:AcrR family transcriptional regulator
MPAAIMEASILRIIVPLLQHSCLMSDPEPMQSPAIDESVRRATIRVLREHGFAGLTLERVAEVAGRARSTLWRQGLTRDALILGLVGDLADDFRATMYPVLTSGGTGRERLEAGLEKLCELLDRHLPLMLATDEAFHQATGPDEPPDYLHPFIRFFREGAEDGSLPAYEDVVEAADIAFNGVAWPYVHLRGRHGWPAERARMRIVGLVLNGIAGARAAKPGPRRKEAPP